MIGSLQPTTYVPPKCVHAKQNHRLRQLFSSQHYYSLPMKSNISSSVTALLALIFTPLITTLARDIIVFRPSNQNFSFSVNATKASTKQDLIFVKGGCSVDASKNPQTTIRSLKWIYPAAGSVLEFYENENSTSKPYAKITVLETTYEIKLCDFKKSNDYASKNYKVQVEKQCSDGVLAGPNATVVFRSSSREYAFGSRSRYERRADEIKRQVGVTDDDIVQLSPSSSSLLSI